MILLDTNVLSEAFRPEPDAGVLAWLGRQAQPMASAVTVGELRRGALVLPAGRRRDAFLASIDATLRDHVNRILPYDGAAARIYAHLHAHRRSIGRPLAVEDGMIAATAIINSASIATRNVTDFEQLGVEVIDPWNLDS
ncbi:type II toxin-antitoxin system VapC family toxin [Nocardioides marmorisolisilvae]|uniref:Ribonuclease VapC n=1 Tax=Nocardioides marmorisolisilvae TaxID=1542737 RepID=A0A3N0DYZ5_9ACTN|nr:type II toxin-antitoxin system VapC family toxin [Nocardioides marmorisolisilvae]RNL80822.1 type II toxin-antitoxin system VapC family toxin [Nocardioides marmorisolisilvae]